MPDTQTEQLIKIRAQFDAIDEISTFCMGLDMKHNSILDIQNFLSTRMISLIKEMTEIYNKEQRDKHN